MIFNNTNSISRLVMAASLRSGNVVVDATVGNGNDISYMLKKVGTSGFAYGFDVQNEAIESTRKKLSENGYKNYNLILDGHENIDSYVKEKINMAVFNLGYLPKFDHSIITKPETTIEAINKIMDLLEVGGKILISAYKGHDGGMEEYNEVKDMLSNIDQKDYNICEISFPNQANNPPSLFVIEKR